MRGILEATCMQLWVISKIARCISALCKISRQKPSRSAPSPSPTRSSSVSFYFWLFQLNAAQAMVAADDFAFIDGLWKDWSPGYD
jgi:hypothetical protein